MKTHALSKSDARRLLTAVVERELERIAHAQLLRTDDPCSMAWQLISRMTGTWARRCNFWRSGGVSGKKLTDQDHATLRPEGKSDTDEERLQTALDMETQAFRHPQVFQESRSSAQDFASARWPDAESPLLRPKPFGGPEQSFHQSSHIRGLVNRLWQ